MMRRNVQRLQGTPSGCRAHLAVVGHTWRLEGTPSGVPRLFLGDVLDQYLDVAERPRHIDLAAHRVLVPRLGGRQAALLLFQILDLPLARAIEAAALNERHDLVQLAGIEEGAVSAAYVHDGA